MTFPELPFDLYPWFSLISRLAILALFMAHYLDARADHHRYHDHRSAIELVTALCLLCVAGGLLASAVVAFIEPVGSAGRTDLRNGSLGVVSTAMLFLAVVQFWGDRHYRLRRPRE